MAAFHIENTDTEVALRLTGDVTIEHMRALTEALKQVLTLKHTLVVDASALTRLDAAALQLLLATAQFASDTLLSASSPAWHDAFTRYASPDPFCAR